MKRWSQVLCVGLLLATGTGNALGLADARVLVVAGTASMPNASEAAYGRRVAERVSRWLDELGIAHGLVTDEDLMRGVPDGCRLLLLAYNPNPPERELASLRAFIADGGKALVFYSASAPLAKRMGMLLGAYQGFRRRGHWGAIRFRTGSAPLLPSVVRQHSRNIRPALPVDGQSHVLAEWYTADGQPTGDPAWVASPHGAWMSHILLEDADLERKKLMVAAMVGRFVPDVWQDVAGALADQAVALRPGMTFAESVGAIGEAAARTGRDTRVAALTRSARVMHRQIHDRLRDGDYAGVIAVCRSLDVTLTQAYATAQAPRWPEWRGVWDHDGTGLYPGAWDRTARELAAFGITDVLANVLWPGVAHFPAPNLVESGILAMYGDQVEQASAAAERHGLRLHVWKVCWKLGPGTDALKQRLASEGRLQVTDTGKQIPWLCPSQPANRQLELSGLRTVLRRYAVTGIHLDYIRYPDSHSCYCNRCRKSFAADTGITIRAWPEDATAKGRTQARFREWRCRQISTFVHACRKEIDRLNPDVRLSAAVYGRYPLCKASVAQDWLTWLTSDWVDFLCPMNYTEDPLRFAAYTSGQISACGTRAGRLFPGIGVTANESRLDAVATIDQVLTARETGARGFTLFDLNPVLMRDILPLLRRGILAPEGTR